jgi:hypothetical protein
MPARRQLPAQRYGRKRVTGIAEGSEEEAAASCGQMSSASSRTCRLRSSGSNDIGETIKVPTPASR